MKKMKKKNNVFVFMGFFLFTINLNSWACSCIGDMNVKTALKKSDLVIIGKTLSIEEMRIQYKLLGTRRTIDVFMNKVTFDVTHKYKGTKRVDKVDIITGIGNGDCGFKFEIGKNYIVYAVKKNKHFNKGDRVKCFFYTDICHRTSSEVEVEKQLIEKYKRRS